MTHNANPPCEARCFFHRLGQGQGTEHGIREHTRHPCGDVAIDGSRYCHVHAMVMVRWGKSGVESGWRGRVRDGEKCCSLCHEWWPSDCFTRDAAMPNGHENRCKACRYDRRDKLRGRSRQV